MGKGTPMVSQMIWGNHLYLWQPYLIQGTTCGNNIKNIATGGPGGPILGDHR